MLSISERQVVHKHCIVHTHVHVVHICSDIVVTMPNGQIRYRLGAGSPSPIHTSDSEETEENKQHYYVIAVLVIVQWRYFVAIRKRDRRIAALLRGNILPAVLRHYFVASVVAEFVGGRPQRSLRQHTPVIDM